MKASGKCKLTGQVGKLVKAHIIPKAFTKPAIEGEILFQHKSGQRAQKRRTSWYDQSIVTADGEKILSDLDNLAISFLRTQRLVWSALGTSSKAKLDIEFGEEYHEFQGYGYRRVEVDKQEELRKFVLSLLWRASVSSLPEMAEVKLPSEVETRLSRYITGKCSLPIDFYPCTLVQYHTIGFVHNMTPIYQMKPLVSVDPNDPKEIGIFRFYFDGLVLHFHDHSSDNGYTRKLGELIVGAGSFLHVACVPFEKSFEWANTVNLARESLW